MANLKKVIYINEEDYSTLINGDSLVIDGTTYTYEENALYVIKNAGPPEYAETAGYATNAGTSQVAVSDASGNNIAATYGKKPLIIEVNESDNNTLLEQGTYDNITQALALGRQVILKMNCDLGDNEIVYLQLIFDYTTAEDCYNFGGICGTKSYGALINIDEGFNIKITGIASSELVVYKANSETITGNKTFTGTVSLGSNATATTPAATDNDTSVATTAFVKTVVANSINELPSPMIFKGSLGTGGTITALPAATTSNEGYTYKVITDGTYGGQSAKIGDTFISDGSNWIYIPSGDEPSGTVTNVKIQATSPIAIDDSSAITTSGTRTISHNDSGVTAGTYKSVTVDAKGHVTGGTNPITLAGYGITDAIDTSSTAQTKAGNLTAVKFITKNGTSSQFVKGDGSLDNNAYLTTHQDISGKLDKTTFEWNKQLSNGLNGKVCLGKFFMYDSNVTIKISLTTLATYNATIVLASQNLNRAGRPGSINVNVYGDADNLITPLLSVFRPNPNTENGSVEVYANLPGWSKCLVHVQGVNLETKTEGGVRYVGAYDILSSVSAIPTEISGKTILTNDGTAGDNKVGNLLKANYYSKVSNGTSSQFLKADGSVDETSYGTYSKPSGGIPKTDLASAVQTSLGKADTALQSFTETDPTVPAWAKAANKPSYTAAEVGALPDTTVIPAAPGTLNTTATTAQSTNSSEALSGNITLHKVAKTGTYNDLIGKPTIPAAQVQSDWNATSGMGVILNKPTIPTVNNAILTIQKNGTTVNTFTANASSNVTANIQVNELPTVSSSDNGKILQVVNGAWSLVMPTAIYTGSSTPSNSLGNDGDIYVQS